MDLPHPSVLHLGSVQRVVPESRIIPVPTSSACTEIQDTAVPQARALLLELLHSSSFPLFPLPDVPPDPLAPLSGLQPLAHCSASPGVPSPRMALDCVPRGRSQDVLLWQSHHFSAPHPPGGASGGRRIPAGGKGGRGGIGGWKCPPSWGNRHLLLRMTS